MLQVEKIGPNYWVKFGTECYLHLNCCWKWGSNYRDSSLQLVERWDFSTLNLRKNPWNLVKGNYHIEKLVQMLVITPEFKMVVSSDHSFQWDELKRELFYFMKSFIIKKKCYMTFNLSIFAIDNSRIWKLQVLMMTYKYVALHSQERICSPWISTKQTQQS